MRTPHSACAGSASPPPKTPGRSASVGYWRCEKHLYSTRLIADCLRMQSASLLASLCRSSAARSPRMLAATKMRSNVVQRTSRFVALSSAAPVWSKSGIRSFSATTLPSLNADLPVKVETISVSPSEDKITAESMLVPLSDLVPIPDSFSVVHVGGKQVCQI